MKKLTLIMVCAFVSMFLTYAQNTVFQGIVSEKHAESENPEEYLQGSNDAKGKSGFLLFEDFESVTGGNLPQGWTKVTVSGQAWLAGALNIKPHSGSNCAAVVTNQSNNNNSWMFSPALELVAGKSYKIMFWTMLLGNKEKLEVKIGTSASVEGMEDELYNKVNVSQEEWTENVLTYTPATTGTYYIGFHCYSGNANATLLDDVSVYELSTKDAGAVLLNLKQYISSAKNYTISGKIRNYGSDTLTSCKVNYQIDAGTVNTHELNNIRLFPDKELSFTHSITVTPVIGEHTIKVWTSDPNGATDFNPLNDTIILQYKVFDANIAFRVCPLLEGFTASTCGPCKTGNTILKNVLNANTGIYTLIKYQMNFPNPGDPYYTAEGGTKAALYYVNGVPELVVNGTQSMNTSLFSNSILLTEQNNLTFIGIDAEYTVEGQTVRAKVTVNPIASSLAGNNLKLFIAIVEKQTTQNVKSNGETEFTQVMKKFMPNANGISIGSLTQGTPVVKEATWEFKGNYRLPSNGQTANIINHNTEHSVEDFNNLTVVAWVQNMQTKEVFQSATAQLPSGIKSNEGAANIKIFPNPSTDMVTIENVAGSTIEVFDLLGHLLIEKQTNNNTENISVKELSQGIYFVKVQKGKIQTTLKLIKE